MTFITPLGLKPLMKVLNFISKPALILICFFLSSCLTNSPLEKVSKSEVIQKDVHLRGLELTQKKKHVHTKKTIKRKIKTQKEVQKESELKIFITRKSTKTFTWELKSNVPLKSFVFKKDTSPDGALRKNWLPQKDFILFKNKGEQDELARQDGSSFNSATLQFTLENHLEPPKGYYFFFFYTNDDVILFNRHISGTGIGEREELNPRLKFSSDIDPLVHVHTTDKDGFLPESTWEYIFFGKNKPLAFNKFQAFIDPGAPQWILDLFYKETPRLVRLYEKELGFFIEEKLTLYFTYNPKRISGVFSKGATQDGIIQLSYTGSILETKKGEAKYKSSILHLIAHELAHYWNHQLIHSAQTPEMANDRHSWIWEGSSEALTFESLTKLKLMTEEEKKKEYKKNRKLCLRETKSRPLVDCYKDDSFESYYHCGVLIHSWIGEELRKQGQDIFDFWHEFISFIKAEREGLYTDKDFIEFTGKMTKAPTLVEKISQLVYE